VQNNKTAYSVLDYADESLQNDPDILAIVNKNK